MEPPHAGCYAIQKFNAGIVLADFTPAAQRAGLDLAAIRRHAMSTMVAFAAWLASHAVFFQSRICATPMTGNGMGQSCTIFPGKTAG
jgi:hypothetical protein